MKLYSNFCHTRDEEQIFFATNFPHTQEVENLIVLNYGLVCNNEHWKFQMDYFNKKGYHFLIHDFRGHYQSTGRENVKNITFKNITQDLHQILQLLKFNNLFMLGHSMGVNVCLEYCRNYPHVKKQVLISGTIFPVQNVLMNTHFLGALRPFLQELLKKFPTAMDMLWKYGGWNAATQKLFHASGFNMEQVDKKFIEIYLNKLGELGPNIFFQLLDEMQSHDCLSFVEKIKIPSLIIGGNKDKVIPNYLQRLLAEKLPQGELYLMHDGSHVPQVDFPQNINERIDLFFEID